MAKPKKADEHFSAEYMAFVEWQATPADFRDEDEPYTMEAFAKQIKVNRKTLNEWQKKDGHWERVAKAYDRMHGRKSLMVRDALFERTQGVAVQKTDKKGEKYYIDMPPDVNAIELWLEYEAKWQRKRGLENMGNAMFVALDKALADKIAKKVIQEDK